MRDGKAIPVDDGLVAKLIDLHESGVGHRYVSLPANDLPSLRQGKDIYGKHQGINHECQ